MQNKKYSIRKVSAGIISIVIGISTMNIGVANAQESDNKVVINVEVLCFRHFYNNLF